MTLPKSYWGEEYAIEVLSGFIDFVFQHTEFFKLEAYYRSENIKSGEVLKKFLMYQIDHIERFIRENTIVQAEVCYCIDRNTYKSS